MSKLLRGCVVSGGAALAMITLADVSSARACDGRVGVLRVWELREGKQPRALEAAARAHQAWYRAQGVADNRILVLPALAYDPDGGTAQEDGERVVVLHINPPPLRDLDAGDGAWRDFTEQYEAAGTVVGGVEMCLPAAGL